jgi:hypothetical protein
MVEPKEPSLTPEQSNNRNSLMAANGAVEDRMSAVLLGTRVDVQAATTQEARGLWVEGGFPPMPPTNEAELITYYDRTSINSILFWLLDSLLSLLRCKSFYCDWYA